VRPVRAPLWCGDMVTSLGSGSVPPTGFQYALPATHPGTTNVSVASKTSLTHISDIVAASRISLFGHVAQLGEKVPACSALGLAVDIRSGVLPSRSWRRPRGRPRCRWLDPFVHDSAVSVSARWSDAVNRGHSSLAQHHSVGQAMK